ncbi:copper transporter [Nonomuraea basaltis]|uniref:copper transporter n=1 Tax=Nonomuraea basaltis TaxID=2495887 RepID=UPI00110C6167|nr:copper transporter [Nonomuraea basaltis]TMR94692.1 copper transporter [Nonomuraea basaltis]
MIDFRYHLVSIVAIFLALAVGIVLGTTLLQDPAIDLAKRTSDELTSANNGLRADLDTLRGRQAGNDAFITASTLEMVAGDLAGQRVLLIESPGSSTAVREATQQVLEQAGADITGRLTLTEKFLDPTGTGVLDGLVNQFKPANMVFPTTATAWDRAAMLLAAALVTNDPAQANTPNSATTEVIGAFETGGLLSIDGDIAKRATLAVMFAPEKPYEGDSAEALAGALVSVANGLDGAGQGTVLAGEAAPTAVSGDVISALRDESDIARRVSTVDTADMPVGRVVIVYSLREQLSGRAGQYGIGKGASAPQPPVTSASPSPTQSGS